MKLALSLFIILFVVFTLITYNLMGDFPAGEDCCKDIRDPENIQCQVCDDYALHERIIYVWRFRGETNTR